ncbi:MAG: nucleotidyltransferase domain-containing protein [Proteobacteria bacterium]|nr:nucleotidyltransferase domain-containing protein [Pseudomonadota bacterium]
MNALLTLHRPAVNDLCRRTHVRRLDAFGSVVRGDFNPATSDLDFLVEFEALDPTDYANAYFELKEGLEALFARPVDLVTGDSVVNPYFKASVEGARQPVYAG